MVQSGYILRAKLTGFVDTLDMGCDRSREWLTAHLGPCMEIRKIGGGII